MAMSWDHPLQYTREFIDDHADAYALAEVTAQ